MWDTFYNGTAISTQLIEENRRSGHWIIDSRPCPEFPIYTRGNVGEVFPDVVKPFSWSLWGIPHAEPGWRLALANIGAFDTSEFPADQMAMLGVFGGYCYLNVSASRIFGVRAPGLTPEAIDQSFFGDSADVPPYEPRPTDESEEHTAKLLETIGWVMTVEDLPDVEELRQKAVALRNARPDLATFSDQQLVDRVKQIAAEHWGPAWVRHIMATYHSLIPAGAVEGVCAAVGMAELASEILSTDKPVASAEPAKALWRLSRFVRASGVLTEAFDNGTDGVIDRIAAIDHPDAVTFIETWRDFIASYGFRGPNEWEMASPVWEIDPATPLSALNAQRQADDVESPETRKQTRDQARQKAIEKIGAILEGDAETLGQFQAAANATAVIFAGRESTRASCAVIVHEMRMPMYELGRRFVEKGVLKSANEFSLLTVDEWEAVLTEDKDVSAILDERRSTETRLSGLMPPFIVNASIPDIAGWTPRSTSGNLLAKGEVLQGLGGCAGKITGRARIVRDPSEPGDLRAGDILVAKHTDPSWTPIFSAVSGVIVDVGAAVSHAVIVARELGVPCVVSATDATLRIPDGATVEIDGGAGTVTLS